MDCVCVVGTLDMLVFHIQSAQQAIYELCGIQMSDINMNICWWHHKSKGKIVASPNIRQGKTDGPL